MGKFWQQLVEALTPVVIDSLKYVIPAAATAAVMWFRSLSTKTEAQKLAAEVAVHAVEADSVAMDNPEKREAAVNMAMARLPAGLRPKVEKLGGLVDDAVVVVKQQLRRSIAPGVGPVPIDPDEVTPTLRDRPPRRSGPG